MNRPNDDPVIEAMARSEYLSAARLVGDTRAALDRMGEFAAAASALRGCTRVALVGSGGSYAAALTAQVLADSLVTIPVHAIAGTDLTWRRPRWLDPSCAVVLVSYSGTSADVVGALATAREAGCPTLGITGRVGSPLDVDCSASCVYEGTSIYEVPIMIMLSALAGLDRSAGADGTAAGVAAVTAAFGELPAAFERNLDGASAAMRSMASELSGVDHLYVLGAGGLAPLGYKLAPVLMENVRIGAGYYDASEFRHGSVEFLERHAPHVLGLLGTDGSRPTVAGLLRFIGGHGTTHVLDAADHAVPHPLLAPLVLNPITQWLVAWMAADRGIADLDERVFMGKGLLSAGSWP